jgi:hypothetical protein
MPTYTFENAKTGEEHTELMTIAEMESYLKKNKNIRQVFMPINIIAGVSGITHKNDQGWKETLSKIAEANPHTPLGRQHGRKDVKTIKTKQAVQKMKKKYGGVI